ncbi:hypothetical protein C8R44DRAFT_736143 [Mycena epipterygia]|nr:hypothetical protein C8R44DRAFT_736143 [Mycena epipterygia]
MAASPSRPGMQQIEDRMYAPGGRMEGAYFGPIRNNAAGDMVESGAGVDEPPPRRCRLPPCARRVAVSPTERASVDDGVDVLIHVCTSRFLPSPTPSLPSYGMHWSSALAALTPRSPAIALPAAPPLATPRPLRFPAPRDPRSPAIPIPAAPALAAPRPPRFPGVAATRPAPCHGPHGPRSPAIPIPAAPALAAPRPPCFPGAAGTGPTPSSVTYLTSPLRFSAPHPPFTRYSDFCSPGACFPAPAPLSQYGWYWTHTFLRNAPYASLCVSAQHPRFARYSDFHRPRACCPAPAPLP